MSLNQKPNLENLSQDTLKVLFDYDPDTGVLLWKKRDRGFFTCDRGWKIFNKRFAGVPAGTLDRLGYIRVNYSDIGIAAHRLIWVLVYGEIPEVVDHINGISSDNRLVNLRNTTQKNNCRNRAVNKKNKIYISGVRLRKSRWCARIHHKGKEVNLGSFIDFFEACCARKSAERRYGFHLNHGRTV